MTEARVTGQVIQSLATSPNEARVSSLDVRKLVTKDASPRVSGVDNRALVAFTGSARVSSHIIQSLHRQPKTRRQSFQVPVSVTMTEPRGIRGDPLWDKVKFLFSAANGYRDSSKHKRLVSLDKRAGPFVTEEIPALHEGVHVYRTRTTNMGRLNVNGQFPPSAQPDPEAMHIGRKPFCIEAWVYREVSGAGPFGIVGAYDLRGNDRSWQLLIENNRPRFIASGTGSQAEFDVFPAVSIPVNSWTHICVERDSNNEVRLYVNGAVAHKVNSDFNIYRGKSPFSVFGYSDADKLWQGALDDVRVTVGSARYASDGGFTPNTTPLPVIPQPPYPEFTQDPYYDLISLLFQGRDASIIDRGPRETPVVGNYKRHTVTSNHTQMYGQGNPGLFQFSEGDVEFQNVDAQFDLSGAPFTIDVDISFNTSAATNTNFLVVEGQWRFLVNRAAIGFYRWDGAGWKLIVSTDTGSIDIYSKVWCLSITFDGLDTLCMYINGFRFKQIKTFGLLPVENPSLFIRGNASLYISQARVTKGVDRYKGAGAIPPNQSVDWAPTTGPEYVPEPLPEKTYPHLLSVISPDATTDDMEGWTAVQGGMLTRKTKFSQIGGFDNMPAGYWFFASSTTTFSNVVNDIAIPAQYWADIDAGLVEIDVDTVAASARFGAVADGALAVLALGSDGNALDVAVSDAVQNQYWQPRSVNLRLPANTRYIRIGIQSYNPDSTPGLNFSRIRPTLRLTPQSKVWLEGPDYPLDAVDFVVSEGGDVVVKSIAGITGYTSVVQSNARMGEYYFDMAVPSGWLSDVSYARVALTVHTFQIIDTGDTDDAGQVWVEFYNASNNRTGKRVTDHVNYPRDTRGGGRRTIRTRVPTSARTIRVGFRGLKSAMEALSGEINFHPVSVHAFLDKPAELPPAPEPQVVPIYDEHWANVSLLVSARAGSIQNLQKGALDAFNVAGDTKVVTLPTPFGDGDTKTIVFNEGADGSNSHIISVTLAEPQRIGDGAFTMEMWVRKFSDGPKGYHGFLDGTPTGWDYWGDQGSRPLGVWYVIYADQPNPYNEWVHMAVTRDDQGWVSLFINGVKQSQSGLIENVSDFMSTIILGRRDTMSDNASWCGYLDEIRLTKGIVRYTEDFDPPRYRFPVSGPPSPFDDYPASTHWRLVFTATTQSYIQLQEAVLIDEDGSLLTTGVTLTASSTYASNYAVGNLISRTASVWCSAGSTGGRGGDHVTYVFTEPKKVLGAEIWYDNTQYRPNDVVLQYSEDGGVTWTPAGQMGDGTLRGANARFRVFSTAYREFAAEADGAHKFWRFVGHMQTGADYVQVQEITPIDAFGVDRYDHDAIRTASSQYDTGNWRASNAFDIAVGAGAGWASNISERPLRKAHAQIEYLEPVEIVAVGITPHSQYSYTATPLVWDVMWSDDGENWTLKKQISRDTQWTSETRHVFLLD